MNEEIKKILNGLSKKASIYKMQINEGASFNTDEYEANELLNYITNLQKENQKLNKIIDNAIDYIYKNNFDKEEPTKLWFRVFKRDLHGHAQKLLDILKKEVE